MCDAFSYKILSYILNTKTWWKEKHRINGLVNEKDYVVGTTFWWHFGYLKLIMLIYGWTRVFLIE